MTFFQRKNIFITIKYAEFIKIDTKTRKIHAMMTMHLFHFKLYFFTINLKNYSNLKMFLEKYSKKFLKHIYTIACII
jgi:hypothetical protein